MPEEDDNLLDQLSDEQISYLVQKGLVLEQLLQSDKFQQFFAVNYDLVKHEDNGELYVVEVPDEVAMGRASEAMKAQAAAGPRVVTADNEDLKRYTKDK